MTDNPVKQDKPMNHTTTNTDQQNPAQFTATQLFRMPLIGDEAPAF